jgi:hypothetical protein
LSILAIVLETKVQGNPQNSVEQGQGQGDEGHSGMPFERDVPDSPFVKEGNGSRKQKRQESHYSQIEDKGFAQY